MYFLKYYSSLTFFFQFHLILFGSSTFSPFLSTHLRNLVVLLQPVPFLHSQLLTIHANRRFILPWRTAPMSEVVLLKLLSIFSIKSRSMQCFSSTIQTSPNITVSPPLSCCRLFHGLSLFSRNFFFGNQEYLP